MSEIIGIIGSGFMGSGIGAEFLRGGYNVIFYDTNEEMFEKSKGSVNDNLTLLLNNEIINQENYEKMMKSFEYTNQISEVGKKATLIIEAVFEDISVKKKVFNELDSICPKETILASNTSALSIKTISEETKNPERIMGIHFLHPAGLIPLVEITPIKDKTKPEIIEKVKLILENMQKKPITIKKEIPGFVAARLQAALFRESLHLVQEGICEPEEIDTAVVSGFGRRLTAVGPFQVADMAGLDIYSKTSDSMFPNLSKMENAQLLEDTVKQGNLGTKSNKGFYNWTPESATKLQTERDTELVRRLKQDYVQ